MQIESVDIQNYSVRIAQIIQKLNTSKSTILELRLQDS